jgi:hypothetical protein
MEYPHASEEIVHMYNDFRSNIVLLQELKTAVHNTEQEIDQLQIRLKAEKDIVSVKNICNALKGNTILNQILHFDSDGR